MGGSQKDIEQELEEIKNVLGQFKAGISIEEIKKLSGLDIGLRTLQRRLAQLQEEGSVSTLGYTRATQYKLINKNYDFAPDQYPSSLVMMEPEVPYGRAGLSISKEGEEIQILISQPEQRRKRVTYNSNFLKSYRPNIDSYLYAYEKEQLAKVGRTTAPNQPAGTYAKEILSRLLVDLSWNSSRLEGNTYTLLDTQRLIAQGEAADEKSVLEAQMILNHKDAIDFIVQSGEDVGINRYTILSLHAILSDNLLPDPASSGRLRSMAIGITKSVYTPLGMPQQIEEMFELIIDKAAQIHDPFEQAFFIMVHIPYLQPFDDVNKRVSRLAVNLPFIQHNLSPLSFVDVPHDIYIQGMLGIYELNRVELLKDVFMWAYERSAIRYAAIRQTIGEPDPFRVKYREEIRSAITAIVVNALSLKEASAKIEAEANKLAATDHAKFVEMVDTELIALHEGNFAKYKVRPSEFRRWKELWDNI